MEPDLPPVTCKWDNGHILTDGQDLALATWVRGFDGVGSGMLLNDEEIEVFQYAKRRANIPGSIH